MPAIEQMKLSAKYKNNNKLEECRRRRSEVTVELRKMKKDDQLLKRRNIHIEEVPQSPEKEEVTMTMEEMIRGLDSTDMKVVMKATQSCRKMLSRQNNPPIDIMIQKGIVPKCVANLSMNELPALQFESAWVLTNIASGTKEQTRVVIENNAVPALINLLESTHMNVLEQAVWALGNIAGDGPEGRSIIFAYKPMQALVRLCNPNATTSLIKNAVWTISNLCRCKESDKIEDLKPALKLLRDLLMCQDKDVISDTCWSWSYLTDGCTKKIQMCIDANIVPHLIEKLGNTNESQIITPVLRAIGNIVTGSDMQTDTVLNHGVLKYMDRLLQHEKRNIVKEAAWTISNILAGNKEQIQCVIDAGLLVPLINVLQIGDPKSKKEAAFAIMNITSGGTVQQIAYTVQTVVLHPLCDMLESCDAQVINVVLESLTNIMKVAEKSGELDRITLMIEECGGLDKIELLQNHENKEIYEKAINIIENFFGTECGDENVAPVTNFDGKLGFEVAAPKEGFNF